MAQVERLNGMGPLPANADVVVAPSALHLLGVKAALRPEVATAIQDIHTVRAPGAYTGSHTVEQVKEVGVPWVVTGHSERRCIWHEADADTATKTRLALDAGLGAIACIGETLAEREAGHTLDVVFRQTQAIVDAVPAAMWGHLVLAYEPVWAIGTGKVATAEQAQEVHAALRAWLVTHVGAEVAAAVRIIYGGSVTVRWSGCLLCVGDTRAAAFTASHPQTRAGCQCGGPHWPEGH